MLCYRFMWSNKLSSTSSYLKLYDAEIVPLLLRIPSSASSTSLYSTLPPSGTVRQQQKEREFIRSSRFLFHTSCLRPLQEKPTTSGQSSVQPPPPASTNVSSAAATPSQTEKDEEVVERKEIPLVDSEPEKLGLFARFKKMYKEYWYVLLPVHVVTSAGWLGGFFYLSKSGFDVATLMESWHFNEMIVAHLRDSKLGHVAIAYFLYKCFTPLRYMLTLGTTTYAIKSLSRLGYIRPVPSRDALMKMYQDKKDSAKQAIQKKTHGGSNSI